jgi:UDP-N-acetylglucosamine 2-epimerase
MILLIYGTRPEYIKIKPLIIEMEKRNIPFKTLFTGQHKDMVPATADYNLAMFDLPGNRLDSVLKNCLSMPEHVFEGITYILVQGDTTSVVGLALAGLHRNIPVIHLEAGLRTYDTQNPYPEENNRRIVSSIATIHLCPTFRNEENLIYENIAENIFVVGNTGLDNLLEVKDKCTYEKKILVTLHRRENHHWMDQWFTELNTLAQKYPEYEFIIPLHPNPNVQKHKALLTNVKVVDPMEHSELIDLLTKCSLVITDSGGLQEECSFLNKKCLVCRKVTERPE